ncbi:MAG: glutamate racemase [Firmicutes bacterium]|nr:glutamate racemase [Bacillota bacterium]
MSTDNHRPIAIFDSGEGGLTVLKRAYEWYPGENYLYAADALHFPYGSRSLEEVRAFFLQFLDFFVQQSAKAVIIACNTATAAALQAAQAISPIPVIGVIQPGARAAAHATQNGRIAVLSTYATYRSAVYQTALQQVNSQLHITLHPCSTLVTMAETGQIHSQAARRTVRACLHAVLAEQTDTIVLGCTHFPHMEQLFLEEMSAGTRLIDPGLETVKALTRLLGPLRTQGQGHTRFYTTGQPQQFEAVSRILWPEAALHVQPLTWSSLASLPHP